VPCLVVDKRLEAEVLAENLVAVDILEVEIVLAVRPVALVGLLVAFLVVDMVDSMEEDMLLVGTYLDLVDNIPEGMLLAEIVLVVETYLDPVDNILADMLLVGIVLAVRPVALVGLLEGNRLVVEQVVHLEDFDLLVVDLHRYFVVLDCFVDPYENTLFFLVLYRKNACLSIVFW